MKKFDTTLYFITDSTGWTEEEFLFRVEESLKGGATILQLREKNKSTKVWLSKLWGNYEIFSREAKTLL